MQMPPQATAASKTGLRAGKTAKTTPYVPPRSLASTPTHQVPTNPPRLQIQGLGTLPEQSKPWQAQVQPDSKARRRAIAQYVRRQDRGAGVGNVAAGYPACNSVGNDVWSCYPEEDSVLVQDEWSKFLWNANQPSFIGAGSVDVHLYNAGSEDVVTSWLNISNSRGSIGIQPNDVWLPTETSWTQGTNVTLSYYFIVATQGAHVDGSQPHGATFKVVQTAPPATLSSVIAASATPTSLSPSEASASVSSLLSGLTQSGLTPEQSSAILSSLSSLRVSTVTIGTSITALISGSSSTSLPKTTSKTNSPSSLQNDGNGGHGLADWAIAVIAVLGVLALLATLILIFFLLRVFQRKRENSYTVTPGDASNYSSTIPNEKRASDMTSAGAGTVRQSRDTPVGTVRPLSGGSVTASAGGAGGPISAGTVALGVSAGVLAGSGLGRRSATPREDEDTFHDARDSGTPVSGHRPDPVTHKQQIAEKPSSRSLGSAIAPQDAAIMADAFRNVLRKPEFPAHDSGSSGENGENGDGSTDTHATTHAVPSGFEGEATPRVEGSREHGYGGRKSDEEAGSEAQELMRSELASEGTSVRSNAERKRPEIRDD